jgi:hypothetical protein
VCVYSVCVVLCLGTGLATGCSLVQGVLPSVKNDYRTEQESWALNGLEEPFKKKQDLKVCDTGTLIQVLCFWTISPSFI